MSGVILAVLDHAASAGVLLAAAQRLAELTGTGRINALLVRAPPESGITPGEEIMTARREVELRAIEARRADAVRADFDTWLPRAEHAGIEAEWTDTDGIVELVVEERGRRADFLVVEQPVPHDYGTSWQGLRAALFGTGRPVLVLPAQSFGEFGHRVAIAWRDEERAAKAVRSGLRCITHAERVFVLAGIRDAEATPAVPAILVEHGIAAEMNAMPIGSGAFGAALLARAHELGADMMVMGAHLHHPLRELLLGGVTSYMLAHADIPVLMRH